jgi:methionyl-tRNA formyltransferase
MRIGYFGDGVWAQRALSRLVDDPRYTIAFVAVRASRTDAILVAIAEAKGIPVLRPERVNAPESIADIARFGAELHVSMSYDQILRDQLLAVPPRGTLNCHAGALPFYRGRNPLTWAIINGETDFGVTVHWVDRGIDTGDIVRQVKVPISATDTYATLLTVAESVCADTLVDAISDVYQGSDERVAQSSIDPVGLYCCRRREGDEEIDWSSDSALIDRFVRALVPPGPGARTLWKDQLYAVLALAKVAGARAYIGAPGEVIGRDGDGVLVKTGDSFVRITLWAPVAADGTVGESLVPDVPRGVRLGRDPRAELARIQARLAILEADLALVRRD